jgi:hypothetical protein
LKQLRLIEAESEAVLNTLTEHDFQDVFKKCQKCWELCIQVEGAISGVTVANRPRARFDQMAAPVPGNYG